MYLIAPLVCALMGCDGEGDDETRSRHDNTGKPYAYEMVECGNSAHTSIEELSREVITGVHEFREVYGVTDLNRQEEVPDIDFSTQQVVAIHSGWKPNPGYGLRIDEVVTHDGSIVVRYTDILANSSDDCAYPAMVVSPYCFIAMKKSDLPVTYAAITDEASCGG